MEKFQHVIRSVEELEQLAGKPRELVNQKVVASLDRHCRHFISLSPLVFVATSGADEFMRLFAAGRCSPVLHTSWTNII
ncbi:hypothetical protein VQ056_31915 [Paenibacillus sp. JTLBN-2024]